MKAYTYYNDLVNIKADIERVDVYLFEFLVRSHEFDNLTDKSKDDLNHVAVLVENIKLYLNRKIK